MAAGIFLEINITSEHAKEAINFGLGSIECVDEHDEKIHIKVGINTGGPITAGVLGTRKPTFEMLWPAINLAQEMEQTGIEMEVHITRQVYEQIYGESFKVKERGLIEVKNGSVVTYIIDKRWSK